MLNSFVAHVISWRPTAIVTSVPGLRTLLVKNLLTLSHESLYKIREWRNAVHPSPPSELAEGLKDTIATKDEFQSEFARHVTRTHNVPTKENSRLKSNEEISALGLKAAIACPKVV